ncbi:MAG: class I SAM-dependent methyltransferase, partial [Patescibacteria group bacterium]
MTVEDIEKMNYSQFVGLIKERNRPSGGIKTVHTVAVNAFIDNSKRMLEIGSNTGFTSINMSLLTGCEVVGIDSNEPSINEAKSYAEALGAHDVDFVTANALDLPFEDASFDVVWSSNVTSFIGDKNKAISEYLRVLKPGGILVVVPIYYCTEP